MRITEAQIKAAIGLLGLTAQKLCDALGITRQAYYGRLSTGSFDEIQTYLENSGIEFLEYEGVRKTPAGIFRLLAGHEGFKEFIYDVHNTVKERGGHICVTNVDERQFERWQGAHAQDYLSKMAMVENLTFQILVKEGDGYKTATYAEYRHAPIESFSGVPTYIYGDKKAEILFERDNVTIFLFENQQLADAQRRQFRLLWEKAIV